jgi:hypothetical protein
MCNCGMSNDPNAPQNFGTPPINNTQSPSTATYGGATTYAGLTPMNWLLVAGALAGGVVAGKKMKKSKRK